MTDAEAIGAAIRGARRDAGITQQVLAELAGISERTVRSIETGAGAPSLPAVVAAAAVVGLHLAAIR